MKPTLLSALAATGLGISVAAGLSSHAGARDVPAPEWQSDFEAARALSRASGKPLFVAFR